MSSRLARHTSPVRGVKSPVIEVSDPTLHFSRIKWVFTFILGGCAQREIERSRPIWSGRTLEKLTQVSYESGMIRQSQVTFDRYVTFFITPAAVPAVRRRSQRLKRAASACARLPSEACREVHLRLSRSRSSRQLRSPPVPHACRRRSQRRARQVVRPALRVDFSSSNLRPPPLGSSRASRGRSRGGHMMCTGSSEPFLRRQSKVRVEVSVPTLGLGR